MYVKIQLRLRERELPRGLKTVEKHFSKTTSRVQSFPLKIVEKKKTEIYKKYPYLWTKI